MTPTVNIVSAEFKADPFPLLAALRASEPVYRTTLPDKTPVWLVTRYEDVNALLKDERFPKNRRNALTPEQLRKLPWVPPMFRPLERNMLDLDPPDHTRLRALVHKAFTPRLVERMRGRVQALADELLDKVTRQGEMELIADYALPLPMTIITEILGVPDRGPPQVSKWSQAVVSLSSPNPTVRVIPSVWMFIRYLRRFFKVRQARPAGRSGERTDPGGGGRRQAERGRAAGDGLPAADRRARDDRQPDRQRGAGSAWSTRTRWRSCAREPALMKAAVEELLRYTAPVFMTTERYAREDVTLHGVTIPRGEMTLGVIGSANRDEAVFENPDTLDITREPNRHLSFGQGIHFCLGAPLARMEAQIAIGTLLGRMPGLRLKVSPDTLRWRPSMILRGLDSLPVLF